MTAEELKLKYTEKAQNIIAEGTKKLEDLWKEYDRKIEELQKESYRRWKPEYGENYYYISALGVIKCHTYKDDSYDNERFNYYNMFKTEEEAEFAAERWKVMRGLEMLSDDDKLWDSEKHHYAIRYNYFTKSLYITYYTFDRIQPFYFKSKESGQRAIDIIGEDILKKYWFGIKEE